jgi:hypothetical protein
VNHLQKARVLKQLHTSSEGSYVILVTLGVKYGTRRCSKGRNFSDQIQAALDQNRNTLRSFGEYLSYMNNFAALRILLPVAS